MMEEKFQVFFNGSFVIGRCLQSGIEVSLDEEIFALDVFIPRKTPARRSFRRAVNILKSSFQTDDRNVFLFHPTDSELGLFLDKLRRIDRRVSAIINAPLSSRSVENFLNISAEECRRWTKSGKLPGTTKVASSRTKKSFTVTLYPSSLIQNLVVHPHIIEDWRREELADPGEMFARLEAD
ncbi:hypothetical protein [Brucella tritici]|uniref:hypothetical protein n=1 Tax=Brucella tritici TaxID=94626 RepID=UPI001591E7AC|nr:hypothetical protein [Brucella tritici]